MSGTGARPGGAGGPARRGWPDGAPERLYVVGAAEGPPAERAPLDLVTLVVTRPGAKPGAHPEHGAILRLCAGPLSIAELSAYLSLPASTVTVLVAELVEDGRVEARAPMSATAHPVALLEAVMDGLSKI
ncbi:DUF742 domain-containing protein [Actinomadura fibrosa]|uniref:DUF742 domain-containing protein n=1 Tax=Actinomadura fibrosa TaxID=111802 RepID=A0ABW2XMI1_9ACTN|nr:DUF742 domain-containing protein [Actinomadura fibrosa]